MSSFCNRTGTSKVTSGHLAYSLFTNCTVYANEFYLQISISANTSLPRTRPLTTSPAPSWAPDIDIPPTPFQWALQSFCLTSPWRPLFQLALIYFLSLVAMTTLARRCLHYTCTMETNVKNIISITPKPSF